MGRKESIMNTRNKAEVEKFVELQEHVLTSKQLKGQHQKLPILTLGDKGNLTCRFDDYDGDETIVVQTDPDDRFMDIAEVMFSLEGDGSDENPGWPCGGSDEIERASMPAEGLEYGEVEP